MKETEKSIYDKSIDPKDYEVNNLANIIRYISWIELIGGIIFSLLFKSNSIIINIIFIVGIFLGSYSLAEIIQILHDIRLELRKKKK